MLFVSSSIFPVAGTLKRCVNMRTMLHGGAHCTYIASCLALWRCSKDTRASVNLSRGSDTTSPTLHVAWRRGVAGEATTQGSSLQPCEPNTTSTWTTHTRYLHPPWQSRNECWAALNMTR